MFFNMLFSSTDNTIYTGMIFLTSLPLLGVYSQIVDLFKLHWGIQIGIIIYIICLILMLIIFERHLNTGNCQIVCVNRSFS